VIKAMAGLVAAAVVVPGATSAAQPANYNGRLAFASLGTVVVTNPDGGGMWPTRATGVGWVDGWSPDGTKLLVEGENDLFTVDPDGGNKKRLTPSSAYDGQGSYSPDGSKIAFMSTRDGPARVWVMHADGSDAHTITSNFPGSGHPTWSPDGTQIAFTTGYRSVWITSSEGIGARHLVGNDTEPAFEPAWSPDGRTIVVSQRRQGNQEIVAVDVDTGAGRGLTSSDGDDFGPVWSPDGTRIAFESTRTGQQEIFTMAVDGSDERQVSFAGGLAGPPVWQPLEAPPAGFCTIWGTPANDLLVGTPGDDGICGEGGNDRIIGGQGRDALNGDDGNDSIVAGPGFDLVNSGPGDDTIDSRDGDHDFVNGWQGVDTVLADRRIDGTSEIERRLFPEPDNLARGRPVRSSMALPTGPAPWVDDGHRIGFWSSLYATQWVEIDLGKSQTIGRVSLAVAQTPEGHTDHVILGRATTHDRWRGLAELDGTTHDRQLLTVKATRPWRNVRYVRVETRRSPSWVAWKEIAVFRAR
jgi:Ca2+-binding RTX toxin-like protein